jgi:hypothetical protein
MKRRPDSSEFAEYYLTYVSKVPEGDIRHTLHEQAAAARAMLEQIPEARVSHRYGPDKWSIRQVVSHVNDTERVFTFRALWFARGLEPALPSFDQNDAIVGAGADDRDWAGLIHEFTSIRSATLDLFDSLGSDAWLRRGIASGNPFSVRALAWITAGHVEHHLGLLRERYL